MGGSDGHSSAIAQDDPPLEPELVDIIRQRIHEEDHHHVEEESTRRPRPCSTDAGPSLVIVDPSRQQQQEQEEEDQEKKKRRSPEERRVKTDQDDLIKAQYRSHKPRRDPNETDDERKEQAPPGAVGAVLVPEKRKSAKDDKSNDNPTGADNASSSGTHAAVVEDTAALSSTTAVDAVGPTTTTTASAVLPPSTGVVASSTRVSEPGAWSIRPSIVRRNNDEDDSTSTSFDEELGENQGNDQENNNNHNHENEIADNENLIQAELVDENNLNSNHLAASLVTQATILDGKSERRRNWLRFLAVVMAAIVIAVTVTVVANNGSSTNSDDSNNDDNGGGGNQDNNNGGDGNNENPTVSPSQSISPSQAPSVSSEPTSFPTSSPTQLIWNEIMIDQDNSNDEQLRLDGLYPEELVQAGRVSTGGGRFGTELNLWDIANTSVAERTGRTTLLLIHFGRNQIFSPPFPGSYSSFVYLCGGSLEEEQEREKDDNVFSIATNDTTTTTERKRNYCEAVTRFGTADSSSDKHGPSAISGNGRWYIEDDHHLALYDLADIDTYNMTQTPNRIVLHNGGSFIGSGLLQMGLNHDGTLLVEMTSTKIMMIGFDSSPRGTLTGIRISEIAPPSGCTPWSPCTTAPEFYSFAIRGNVLVIVQTSKITGCLAGYCAPYTKFQIFTRDSQSFNEIAASFEVDKSFLSQSTNVTVDDIGFDELVMDLNPSGSVMAISLLNDEVPIPNQVLVYRLENSTWAQVGLPLLGSDSNDGFGHSLSLNHDGTKLAVGAIWDATNGGNAGRVSIYWLEGEEWVPFGSDIFGDVGSELGTSVALHPFEDEVLAGAPRSDPNGVNSGEAFLYNLISV